MHMHMQRKAHCLDLPRYCPSISNSLVLAVGTDVRGRSHRSNRSFHRYCCRGIEPLVSGVISPFPKIRLFPVFQLLHTTRLFPLRKSAFHRSLSSMAPAGRGRGKGGGSSRPQSREVTISKALSFLLRHGAKDEGVRIDEGGWVCVADVVCFNS
jgi:hypothetical protein